jgi:hypothetical protein
MESILIHFEEMENFLKKIFLIEMKFQMKREFFTSTNQFNLSFSLCFGTLNESQFVASSFLMLMISKSITFQDLSLKCDCRL